MGLQLMASTWYGACKRRRRQSYWVQRQVDAVLRFWLGSPGCSERWFASGEARVEVDAEVVLRWSELARRAVCGRLRAWVRVAGARGSCALIIVLDQFSRHIARHYARRGVTAPPWFDACWQARADQLALRAAARLHGIALCGGTTVSALNTAIRVHTRQQLALLPAAHFSFSLMPLRHAGGGRRRRYVHLAAALAAARLRELERAEGDAAQAAARAAAPLRRFVAASLRHAAALRRAPVAPPPPQQQQPQQQQQGACKSVGGGDCGGNDGLAAREEGESGPALEPAVGDAALLEYGGRRSAVRLFARTRGGAGAGGSDGDGGGGSEDWLVEERLRVDADPVCAAVRAFAQAHAPAVTAAPGVSPGVCVSLSGGVDSMVLLCALLRLRRLRIVALHVNYGNRPEARAEASFVQRWCAALGVRCELLDFSTGTATAGGSGVGAGGGTPLPSRAECAATGRRDEYERRTREARYAAYARCLAAHGLEAVALGHHQDDVRENTLTNVLRAGGGAGGLLGLGGMTAEGECHGVRVWRPFVALGKAEIMRAARGSMGVPYFRDTTPAWSLRGQLRAAVMPLLVAVFGAGVPRGLSAAAAQSVELRELHERLAMRTFWAATRVGAAGACIDCCAVGGAAGGSDDAAGNSTADSAAATGSMGVVSAVTCALQMPPLFWRHALRQLLHGLGLAALGEKALQDIVRRLRARLAASDCAGGGNGDDNTGADTGAGAVTNADTGTGAGEWLALKDEHRVMLQSAADGAGACAGTCLALKWNPAPAHAAGQPHTRSGCG
eukprot:g3294.t1